MPHPNPLQDSTVIQEEFPKGAIIALCVKNIFLQQAHENPFFEMTWTPEISFPEAAMPWNLIIFSRPLP